jgi:diguanylate cyclase (GGDEF)-like protein
MALAPRDNSLWWQKQSLRTRIAVFIAVVICAVTIILGGLIGQSSLTQLRARIGQSLATDASRIAERLDSELTARSRELELLAALDPMLARTIAPNPAAAVLSPASAGGADAGLPAAGAAGGNAGAGARPDLAHIQSLLDRLKRSSPAYSGIVITDAAGHLLAATDNSDLSARNAAARVTDARPAPGAPGGTATGGAPMQPGVIELSHEIRAPDGTAVATVTAQIGWQWAAALAARTLTPDEEGVVRREAFLVDSRDRVVIGPGGTVGTVLTLPVISRARAGFYDWTVEDWPDGRYLTGAAVAASDGISPGPGAQDMHWTVLVREKLAAAFRPAYALRNTTLTLGATLAAAFALLGWLLAGWVTAPLKLIAVAAERLRQGDDVELPRIRGPAEIDSLSRSLRALVATLTRNQVALDEMQELALRDPLTGLLNRNGLRLHLQHAVVAAQAEGTGLLLFVCDLDGFKAVNDKLGHAAGDMLLCQIARRVSAAMRQGDAVARLGGDEFVLALRAPEGYADTGAREVAHRVLAAIKLPFDLDGHMAHVGCSLGGAAWPDHAEMGQPETSSRLTMDPMKLDGVFEKADAALYAVKRSGKGRVLMHGEALSVA